MPSTVYRTNWAAAILAVGGIFLGALAAPHARAADEAANYPSRPIRIVVPYQPGGLPDLAARVIGPRLTDLWKQPVVIDNRAGAGGVIGTDLVAKSNPDGNTLVMTSSGHVTLPAVNAELPFDTTRDFAGITLTVVGAYALLVPPSLGVKSAKELIALAQSKPGQLNFASAGTGSGTHFAAELFKDLAKIDVVHVAYRGIPDGLTDTLAGRVQFFMPPLASATALVKDGRLLALGVSRRVPGFESIPTFAELGMPSYNWDGWAGLLAPAKTPRAIIVKLNREVVRILNLPEVKQRFVALGADTVPTTPAEFDKLIAEQIAMTSGLARRAGIKPQ
jgi:tripartite-type tricarboxylate transporter receptor subunit TctC